jgi:hypothetical protein
LRIHNAILLYRVAGGIVLYILFSAATVYGLAESTTEDGSNAQAVWALGQTGEDVNVGLLSAGNTRQTHEAFYDKDANGLPVGDTHVFCYDFTGEGLDTTDHETWVAGIIAGRGGLAFPNDIGVAPGSNIHSARVMKSDYSISPVDMEEALEELVLNQGCRIIVTGFQLLTDSDGQSQWSLRYDYYAYEYNVVFANAAGNSEEEVTVFGDCYNGITTGGLAVTDPDVYRRVGSVSNPGPTLDGRRKPDLVAPSQDQTMPHGSSDSSWYTYTSDNGATSFSMPHTAGVAALLLGLADDTNEPNDGQNEVLRAVMVNSAFPNIFDKAGDSTDPADPNNVWHPDRGYGRIDALRAYELLAAGRIYEDTPTGAQKGWAYETMTAAGQEDVYFLSGTENHRLVMTVTWNRKVRKTASSYSEENPPKFNLDLSIVKSPEGLEIFEETSTLDNLEKIDIVLPDDGTYEIHLVNTTTKTNRSYALAFEILPPITGDIDLDYIVDYGDLNYLVEHWLEQGPELEADLWPDGRVDMRDFCVFGEYWHIFDEAYYVDQ